ncbi:hypothetical protein DAI22_12g099001 [Oryza sativa Japonica Group]|nr:hypothetical protein DAI22_12g099001 [Oryza sativa Japonica Group]
MLAKRIFFRKKKTRNPSWPRQLRAAYRRPAPDPRRPPPASAPPRVHRPPPTRAPDSAALRRSSPLHHRPSRSTCAAPRCRRQHSGRKAEGLARSGDGAAGSACRRHPPKPSRQSSPLPSPVAARRASLPAAAARRRPPRVAPLSAGRRLPRAPPCAAVDEGSERERVESVSL